MRSSFVVEIAERTAPRETVRTASASGVRTRRQAWLLWTAGAVFMFALLVFFYPRMTVSVDESRYLSVARYLMEGRAFDRSSDAWFWKPLTDTHFVRTLFSLSPTFSALLIPFVAVGWRSSFVLGTLTHVLAFGGMMYVLRRRGLSPLWATLYLLHPTFVLYSRMVMADVPSSALVVLILVLLHRQPPRHFLAGVVMGFALLMKLSNFPVVATVAAVGFVRGIPRWWSPGDAGGNADRFGWLRMGLGMLPGVAAMMLVNTVFFNSPFGSGYAPVRGGMFGWRHLLTHLPFYVGALMTMYPLMLLSPVFLRGRLRWEMRLSCLAALLFFSAYYFLDRGNGLLEAMVRGLRFQMIVIPFYIVAYSEMMTGLFRRLRAEKLLRGVLAAGIVVLWVGTCAISRNYFEHTAKEALRHEELAEILPRSGTVVAGAEKYVGAAKHPELRVLRLLNPDDLPYLVRQRDLPALLLLAHGRAMRTRAYRDTTEEQCRRVLKKAEEYFEVHNAVCPIEGFETRMLVRKLVHDGRPWHLLPIHLFPETDE